MNQAVPDACQIGRGTTGNTGGFHSSRPGADDTSPQASPVTSRRTPELPKLRARPGRRGCARQRHCTVAEAGRGGARHTRAWSVGASAVVAGCRRLRSMRPVRWWPPSADEPAPDDQLWTVSGSDETPGQRARARRISAQGWPYGNMGCFLPLGSGNAGASPESRR